MGSNCRNGSNSEPNYPKGVIVAFTLKSLSSEGSLVQEESANANKTETESDSKEHVNEESINNKASENVEDNEEKTGTNMEESEEKADEKKEDAVVTGDENKNASVLYKDNKDVVLCEDLKSIFEKFGKIKFIIGANSGCIRFEEAAAAQKARTAGVLDEIGGLSVKNFIALLDPVTGDAEKEYWSLLRNNQERYGDSKGNNRGGRGGGRHNRGGGRHQHYGKNNRSRENDSPNRPNKLQKFEAA